ncbi:DnaJ-like proiein [Sarotherodon galilaeus]
MAAFTWIQMSSLLILMLQFKGTTEQHQTVQTVTAGRGHDVTLPCKNVIQGQHNCISTTWLFSDSSSSVELFNIGQNKEAKPKSDRLSLSADCSLVIKKVTDQDVGRYTCRKYKTATGPQEGPDFLIDLSVINSEDVKTTTKSTIKPTLKITNIWTTKEEVKTSLTTTSNQPDGEDVTTTKSTTVKSTTKTSSTTKSTTSTIKPTMKINTWTTGEELKTSAGTLTTASNIPSGVHSGFIIVPVGLAALLITVVVIIRWKKTKENKTQCGNNTGLSLNPADTESGPGTNQDTMWTDADDGVSYASISFTKKIKNKARAGDDDDTVTYSTVTAASPAGVPNDPSDLYSTINKPKK